MKECKTEGIILQSIPYQEHSRIATIFTPDHGLVKLMVKGDRNTRLTSPLTHVECVYTPKKNDLHNCREISIVDANLDLRTEMDLLDAACSMAKAVQRTQLPQKEAKTLFKLLNIYLQHLPKTTHPNLLLSSFLLKLLKHEGLLHFPSRCSVCDSVAPYVCAGECFCESHAPPPSIQLSDEEVETMTVLTHSRSMEHLLPIHVAPELQEKIETLFDQSLN